MVSWGAERTQSPRSTERPGWASSCSLAPRGSPGPAPRLCGTTAQCSAPLSQRCGPQVLWTSDFGGCGIFAKTGRAVPGRKPKPEHEVCYVPYMPHTSGRSHPTAHPVHLCLECDDSPEVRCGLELALGVCWRVGCSDLGFPDHRCSTCTQRL